VAEKVFPGGVLAVGYRGELTVHPFGRQSYDPKSPAVTADTIYDMASLTKPLATASSIAALAETGRVNLEMPIARFLPEFATGREEYATKPKIGQVLRHTGGFQEIEDAEPSLRGKAEIMKQMLAAKLETEPASETKYSNLGYWLMGEIVERVSGRPLDQFTQARIYSPLGMRSTIFNPPRSLLARIAPTSTDNTIRKRPLHGEVEGSTTWRMGGVSGAAGLFSTAPDVAAFGQMWLNGGVYAHQRIFRRATIERFSRLETLPGGSRSPMWGAAPNLAAASVLSDRALWHTGSTGTSILIDPDRQIFVILLTNTVHPNGESPKFEELRATSYRAVIEAVLGSTAAQAQP
jgi:CubicO group peptidase (beta-lactamase class C family)